jgi:adenylate kinase family enzyme
VLGADDPLPLEPHRIVIAGVSGTGKTSTAARIAELTGIPHTEIDALFHGPDWTPRASFLDDVRALVAGESWVTEWQYADARPLVAGRADLMVWLDLPFRVTLTRVVRRTVRRRLRREELWNGNQEGPLHHFFTDPEHIVRWSIRTRNLYDQRIPAVESTGLTVVRLRSQAEVDRWLGRLGSVVE